MAHAARRPVPSQGTPSPRTRRLRRQASNQAAKNRCPTKHYIPQPNLSSSDIEQPRLVLVPLHPNLRRLPSRILLAKKGDTHSMVMRQYSYGSLRTGSKRKRVFSANENAAFSERQTRNSGRSKRLRSSYVSSDEGDSRDQSEMDVDASTASISGSDESGHDEDSIEDGGRGVSEEDSITDEHLINFADQKQLNRLRKTDLIRLHNLAGLTEDPGTLTKSEIIAAIIDARDDYVSVPPSSVAGKSSDYSSDDGNVAGDEDTDAGGLEATQPPALNLRRRVTMHDLGKSSTIAQKGRSLSLGNIANQNGTGRSKTRYRVNSNERTESRSKASVTQSPTSSVDGGIWPIRSPPATRLRSRQVSQQVDAKSDKQRTPTSGRSSSGQGSKGKAKVKQVGFKPEVAIHTKVPIRHDKEKDSTGIESDLTELSDLERALGSRRCLLASASQPSPRRLRSKDKQRTASGTIAPSQSQSTPRKRKQASAQTEQATKSRVLPTRKVTLKRDGSKDPPEEAVDEEGSEDIGLEDEEDEETEEDDDQDVAEEADQDQGSEEEEVDELASTASATPASPSRRTPLRKRLRPRRKQGSAGPHDGDDEGDGGRVLRSGEAELSDAEDEDDPDNAEEDEEQTDISSELGDDEETIAVEPRRLRNGKIVGEEDVDMEDVEEDIEEEQDEEEEGSCRAEVEEDAEGETDEEVMDEEIIDEEVLDEEVSDEEIMDEEVDLTVATAKTLVRLRRDDLVRLCESRDLEPVGTKPQLAQALLQWRDRKVNECSSPSSAGTVRPPSTTKRRRYHTRNHSSDVQTPILSRSHRVHLDEPRTPVPGQEDKDKEKEGEQDLELDLEMLGLEDREIPPDKLQKLEKIGSGGFKDVYIGKFKGRKIAIAEFRGQLNAMDIKELKLLGEFDHQNIVRFLGVSIPENTRETPVMIVSELCSNGDLFDYIRNVNAPSLRKILVMMLDIALGLEYLHTRKPSVIHRDCKSSNILITSKGTAKIADFGLAKVKQSTRSMVRSLVGTVNWQAPELWHAHPKYNHKVDVFSCAMVYWEMLQWHQPKANRKFPWEGMNEHAIYDIVGTKKQRPSVAGLRKQWSCEIIDLIEHMWKHDPQDRPTMSEVVQKLEDMMANS